LKSHYKGVLHKAGKQIRKLGPKYVVIKKGEHGSLLFTEGKVYAIPSYPTFCVIDPTGAGDTFAGGFMGYLAKSGDASDASVRRAIIMGRVMASFNVEDFSLNRLIRLKAPEISARFRAFKSLTHFDIL